MKYTELQAARLDFMLNILLEYTNDMLDICPQFELPIDSQEKIAQALRISLDLWENPALIKAFVDEMQLFFDPLTLKTVEGFAHSLRGPFYLRDFDGNKALLYQEGTVFEAYSMNRSWESLVPYRPDMIYTTLLPFEGSIVSNLFVMHHGCAVEGPGVERIEREYAQALARGIIAESDQFARAADAINLRRSQGLMEPNSVMVLEDFIASFNEMVSGICLPYKLPEQEIPAILRA